MLRSSHKARSAARRKPATQRGENVVEAVFAAARQLLESRFTDQIPLVELAREADVARASLLLQFPQGWQDVLSHLVSREVNLDEAFEAVTKLKDLTQNQQLFMVLDTWLQRAEVSGLLYPNLRAATFNWGAENQSFYRINFEGCWEIVMELMIGGLPNDDAHGHRQAYLGEALINLTLDLASSEGYAARSWVERRAALRASIDAFLTSAAADRPA
jgi:hypothetical protein